MRKFLLKSLFFTLPILILSNILDVFISTYLAKSNIHAYHEYPVWNDLYKNKIEDEIIILGNSRAKGQVSPLILENKLNKSVYNIGMDGQFFDMQLLRFKELLKHRKSPPKYVISIVDVNFLSGSKGVYNKEQFLPYMLYNADLCKELKNKSNFSYLEFYVPLLRYYGEYQSLGVSFKRILNVKEVGQARYKGYLGVDEKWKASPQKPFIAKISNDLLLNYKEFIKICQKNNIKLIMLYPPEHKSVNDIVKNKNDIIRLLKKLASHHNLQFINFENSILNNSTLYFYNRTHLNKYGSEIYSEMLADTLKIRNIIE